MRRRVAERSWRWTLDEVDGRWELAVLCGTVGLFEVVVLLRQEEVAAWEVEGEAALDRLAAQVEAEPARWMSRGR